MEILNTFLATVSVICSVNGSNSSAIDVIKAQEECYAYYAECAEHQLQSEVLTCAKNRNHEEPKTTSKAAEIIDPWS